MVGLVTEITPTSAPIACSSSGNVETASASTLAIPATMNRASARCVGRIANNELHLRENLSSTFLPAPKNARKFIRIRIPKRKWRVVTDSWTTFSIFASVAPWALRLHALGQEGTRAARQERRPPPSRAPPRACPASTARYKQKQIRNGGIFINRGEVGRRKYSQVPIRMFLRSSWCWCAFWGPKSNFRISDFCFWFYVF